MLATFLMAQNAQQTQGLCILVLLTCIGRILEIMLCRSLMLVDYMYIYISHTIYALYYIPDAIYHNSLWSYVGFWASLLRGRDFV